MRILPPSLRHFPDVKRSGKTKLDVLQKLRFIENSGKILLFLKRLPEIKRDIIYLHILTYVHMRTVHTQNYAEKEGTGEFQLM